MRYRKIFCRVLLTLLFWLATGQLQANTLEERIDALLKDPNLNHGIQGVVVKSLKTGQIIYERNADLVFIPASNFKLLVGAVALDRLGPDFTYSTTVYATGEINSRGVLEGDLVLKGGGDPILNTDDLASLAKQIKSKGISKIAGNLLVDDSYFDDQRLGWGWSWDDIPYYYSAEISALNINRNVVDVYVRPGQRVGSRAVVRIDPPTDYVKVDNSATTGGPDIEKNVWVDRILGSNTIRVRGVVPLGTKANAPEEAITVTEPALYAGYVFRDRLAREGILVLGGVKSGTLPQDATELAVHRSAPLSQILSLLMKPSDNLIAEVLLKTLGAEIKGQGTTNAGIEVETEFCQQIGMDLTALKIVDGSGLSRLNFISPNNLITLLAYMYGHKHASIYINSLPVAGVDGTLRNRMKGTAAEKNVRAKTGYVSRVSSLSGYVNTMSGEPLAFAILMNNHLCANSAATAVQNAVCTTLAELP